MAKATFKVKVIIKRCPLVFMDGEDAGVISTQTATFEIAENGDDDWRVAACLANLKDDILKDSVEVTLEQIHDELSPHV